MSGHHHHRQAVNSLGKGNPSWAIFYSVCTSQNPEKIWGNLGYLPHWKIQVGMAFLEVLPFPKLLFERQFCTCSTCSYTTFHQHHAQGHSPECKGARHSLGTPGSQRTRLCLSWQRRPRNAQTAQTFHSLFLSELLCTGPFYHLKFCCVIFLHHSFFCHQLLGQRCSGTLHIC